jgi:hypothetical protein
MDSLTAKDLLSLEQPWLDRVNSIGRGRNEILDLYISKVEAAEELTLFVGSGNFWMFRSGSCELVYVAAIETVLR